LQSPALARARSRIKSNALLLCMAATALAGGLGPACAYDVIGQTFFLNIKQGSPLSDQVYKLGSGGFELSGGGSVDFRRWYRQNWTEMRVDFMTQVTEGFGILWGLSTGEWGPKYRIAPGFKIGLILQSQLTPLSSISISFTSLLGGRLREKSCEADYGDIGGVQAVNCRLAASTMQPSDTLKYLVDTRPPDRLWVGLRYQARF
jgi:hypothetical protein